MKIRELINELKMSPASLRSRVSAITDAKVGIEFELYVPIDENEEYEPDYSYDGYIETRNWGALHKDITNFFSNGDNASSGRTINDAIDTAYDDYQEWLNKKWREHAETTFSDWWKENNDDEPEPKKYSDGWELKMSEYRDEDLDGWAEEGDKINEWLEDKIIDKYKTFAEHYDLEWPYSQVISSKEANLNEIADSFSKYVGKKVVTSEDYDYHGAKRQYDTYVLEPDSSLSRTYDNELDCEFVSPPLSISEMSEQLKKVIQWANRRGCRTDKTCGLHINVSLPAYNLDQLDYVKLALFVGDEYVSEQFGRLGNSYAVSALKTIRDRIKNAPNNISGYLNAIKKGLSQIASKTIHDGATAKYTSINTKEIDTDKLVNTILRFVTAMDIALDPQKEKTEYAKKLYKLISTSANVEDLDTVKYFSMYSSGNLPKAALASFVKKAQNQRKINKQPPEQALTTGGTIEYWIVRTRDHHKVHEFLAKDMDQALNIKYHWVRRNNVYSSDYMVIKHDLANPVAEYRITFSTPHGVDGHVTWRANSIEQASDDFKSSMPQYTIQGIEQI
jgi:hypothetical protein